MTERGYNGAFVQAMAALRYLANNPRPAGGQESFNTEHLLQITNNLQKSVNTLVDERDEARNWVRKMHQETQVLTCAFCGESYPPNTPESNDNTLSEHIKVCKKHPICTIEEKYNTLKAAASELLSALVVWTKVKYHKEIDDRAKALNELVKS